METPSERASKTTGEAETAPATKTQIGRPRETRRKPAGRECIQGYVTGLARRRKGSALTSPFACRNARDAQSVLYDTPSHRASCKPARGSGAIRGHQH